MNLQINTIRSQNEKLQNIYNNLMIERTRINNIVQDNTLNAAYEDGTIYVTTNYYNYIALTFTTILLILLFIRVVSTPQTGDNNTGILIISLAIVLGLIYIFNKQT
jgi:LPXTG-motif cell wall-anchored protein